MSAAESAAGAAATALLVPVAEAVKDWLLGKSDVEPPVLELLPETLQSEAALTRLRLRNELGHELTDEERAKLGG